MTLTRRRFLELAISGAALAGAEKTPRGQTLKRRSSRDVGPTSINRKALVTRHNPTLRKLDPLAPLSIGNGEFTFTADVTGLQTFWEEYEKSIPLCTMSQWGWHTSPVPAG